MGYYTLGQIDPSGLYAVAGVNWGTIGMVGKSTGSAPLNVAQVINSPDDAKALFGDDSALYESILIAYENGAVKVIAVPADDSQVGLDSFDGDGNTTEFDLTDIPAQPMGVVSVDFGSGAVIQVEGVDFFVDYGNKKIIFTIPPPIFGTGNIVVNYTFHALSDIEDALEALEEKDVQIMVGALLYDEAFLSAIKDHCIAAVSLRRNGCYMAKNGQTNVDSLVTAIESARSWLIAHKSYKDVASALAGRIAGLEPWKDLTMKPLAGIEQGDRQFTSTEIAYFDSKYVMVSFDPPKLAGSGEVISTGWTLDPFRQLGFIDQIRIADHLTTVLENNYNSPNVIGELKMNLGGLISLDNLTTSVLRTWQNVGEIDNFSIINPARNLFSKSSKDQADIDAIVALQNSRRLEGAYVYQVKLIVSGTIIFISFKVSLTGGV